MYIETSMARDDRMAGGDITTTFIRRIGYTKTWTAVTTKDKARLP
jgi:hypothetical protein